MTVQDVSWSDLLQRPTDTVQPLEEGNRALLLHRRDGQDLVLTTARRDGQERELVAITVRLLSAIANDPAARSMHLMDVLPQVFPWMRFLPNDDQAEFAQGLVDVMAAAADVDTPAPVLQLVAEWRNTALVHADPDLAAALRRGVVQDVGPVSLPAA